jgi:hypothetical protein
LPPFSLTLPIVFLLLFRSFQLVWSISLNRVDWTECRVSLVIWFTCHWWWGACIQNSIGAEVVNVWAEDFAFSSSTMAKKEIEYQILTSSYQHSK